MKDGKRNFTIDRIIMIVVIVILLALSITFCTLFVLKNKDNANLQTINNTQSTKITELQGVNNQQTAKINELQTKVNTFNVSYVVDGKEVAKESVLKGEDAKSFPQAGTGYEIIWNKDGKNITEDTVISGEKLVVINLKVNDDMGYLSGTLSTDIIKVKPGTVLLLFSTGIYAIDCTEIKSYDESVEEMTIKYAKTQLVVAEKSASAAVTYWRRYGGEDVSVDKLIVSEPCTLEYVANGCVVKGTPITMADGTYKKVEDIRPNDMILTYNAFEGKMVGRKVITVLYGAMTDAQVFTIYLSNGKELSVVNYELVFNMDTRKYEPIHQESYLTMVGKDIMVNDNGEIGRATITGIDLEIKTVEHYAIYTVESNTYIANDIVNKNWMPYNNYDFVIEENYKIDMDKLIQECEQYGYFTYEEFASVCTQETFDNFCLKYYKPFVIKNNISMQDFLDVYADLQRYIDESLALFND